MRKMLKIGNAQASPVHLASDAHAASSPVAYIYNIILPFEGIFYGGS